MILAAFLFIPVNMKAQELYAKVTINHSQIQGTDASVFENLQETLEQFINDRQWTNLHFQKNERISCNFNITVTKYDQSQNLFTCRAIIQANRPVYNSAYTSTLYNNTDNNFDFEFAQFDQLDFNDETIDNQLTALVAYYAYLIIGLDLDSFSPMGGEDVSDLIKVTGSVDPNAVGFYTLGYTVVNADGFPASASRTVAVVDPNNFASAYFGESQYGSRHYYNAPIAIYANSDGTYTIEDILGGFYCYGRYPSYLGQLDFFLDAVIKLNDDNSISLVSYGDWYWGADVPDFLNGSYDPETGTVSLNMDFGAPFTVRLTK